MIGVRLVLAFAFSAASPLHGAAEPSFAVDVFPAGKEFPRNSEGAVIERADGSLLLVATRFYGGAEDEAEAHLAARESRDGGRTWTAPVVVQENIGARNVMSASLARGRDVRIHEPDFQRRPRAHDVLRGAPGGGHAHAAVSLAAGRATRPSPRVTVYWIVMDVELKSYDLYSPSPAIGPCRALDYWRLPADPRCELLHGRLFASPSPSALHQTVQFLLWEVLMHAARKSGAVVLGAPMDTVLANHSVVQPDLLYVSAGRRHIVKEKVEGTPELVIEVLSPQTARRDRVEKLKLYAESGVREYWIVDPEGKQIDFLVCHEGTFAVVLARDGCYKSEVMPEIELDLADFWREVDRRVP